MPDRSDEFRQMATECLRLANRASDPSIRASLLMMAQKWCDLADGPTGQAAFDTAVQTFNEAQMTPGPVAQQQQQIQPKDDKKE